jgi:hypothetical protein
MKKNAIVVISLFATMLFVSMPMASSIEAEGLTQETDKPKPQGIFGDICRDASDSLGDLNNKLRELLDDPNEANVLTAYIMFIIMGIPLCWIILIACPIAALNPFNDYQCSLCS